MEFTLDLNMSTMLLDDLLGDIESKAKAYAGASLHFDIGDAIEALKDEW